MLVGASRSVGGAHELGGLVVANSIVNIAGRRVQDVENQCYRAVASELVVAGEGKGARIGVAVECGIAPRIAIGEEIEAGCVVNGGGLRIVDCEVCKAHDAIAPVTIDESV